MNNKDIKYSSLVNVFIAKLIPYLLISTIKH